LPIVIRHLHQRQANASTQDTLNNDVVCRQPYFLGSCFDVVSEELLRLDGFRDVAGIAKKEGRLLIRFPVRYTT
jgi:hypothetical protein